MLTIALILCSAVSASDAESPHVMQSIGNSLLQNCIKSRFEIVSDTPLYTVVKCHGAWHPWQSTKTSYNVGKELRKSGIKAQPVAHAGQHKIWKSGPEEFALLNSGKVSTYNSQIQGLTSSGATYVLLFKSKK